EFATESNRPKELSQGQIGAWVRLPRRHLNATCPFFCRNSRACAAENLLAPQEAVMKVQRQPVRMQPVATADSPASSARTSSVPGGSGDGFDAAPVARALVQNTARATLKQGASGADVTALQQALTKLGYDTGGVDGSFGPHTLSAVKQFQTAQGLTADAVVGPNTWAALDAASAGSSTPTPPANPQPAPTGDVYALGSGAKSLGLSYTGTSTPINATHTSSGSVGAFAFQSKLDI